MKKKNKQLIRIDFWKALPLGTVVTDCSARFVVRTTDLRWGLLDIGLPDAFGTNPNWCKLTIIELDGVNCMCLKDSEFEMPMELRKEIMRGAIRFGLRSLQGFLILKPLHPALSYLAFSARIADLTKSPQALMQVVQAIESMPTFNANDSRDIEMCNRFKRLANQALLIMKTKTPEKGGNP